MKKKGFTLVELLVVIAIIALLMGILMPALAKVKAIAYRMVCGTNLAGLGKAMMIYAQDNDDSYPVSGVRGIPVDWTDDDAMTIWDEPDPVDMVSVTQRTITSSWYLLIKYAEVAPNQFVCRADTGTKAFKLSDTTTTETDLTQVWDFGVIDAGLLTQPGNYCSYAYHMPYDTVRIDAGSGAASPVAADRNVYLDKNAGSYKQGRDPEALPEWDDTKKTYVDPDKTGNASAHQREGQNVLFNDCHTTFAKYPNVGIDNDNIYQYWTSNPPASQAEIQLDGNKPVGTGDGAALSANDSYLVNETQYGFVEDNN